jgi:hypothetical protein
MVLLALQISPDLTQVLTLHVNCAVAQAITQRRRIATAFIVVTINFYSQKS